MKSLLFPESAIAHHYLDGLTGIEIGESAHNAFGLDTRNIDYTNSLDTSFKKEELNRVNGVAKIDIIARGDSLPIADQSVDFVINSHVIEHFFDPIGALKEWKRVARRYIFVICPHSNAHPEDCGKELTSLSELLDRHTGKIAPPLIDHHSHYSRWTARSFIEMCDFIEMKVVDVQDPDDKVGNGFSVLIDLAPQPFLNVENAERRPMAYYHVAALNHWREVVSEHFEILSRRQFNGLIKIGFIGSLNDYMFVDEAAKRWNLRVSLGYRSTNLADFEFPTLRLLEADCREGFDGTVLYFHTKGLSSPGDRERFYWRRLMNYAVLFHWRQCMSLLNNYDACGVGWIPWAEGAHFSGNFWWANAKWIRCLAPLNTHSAPLYEWRDANDPHGNRRYACETWISSCALKDQGVRVYSHFGTDLRLWEPGFWDAQPDLVSICLNPWLESHSTDCCFR